jgi:predicted nuclease with TOPRIM domain
MPIDERAELNELQREWRKEVSNDLKELKRTLAEMREEFARAHEVTSLEVRVSALETERAKLIGGAIVLQLLGGFILWIFKGKS